MRRIESPQLRQTARRAIRQLSPVLLVAGLMACQTQFDIDTPPRAEGAFLAERYIGARTAFELPPLDHKRTSSRALVRLSRALDKAYTLLDIEAPYPSIKIVSDSHQMMKGPRFGVAAVTASGEELIFLNRKYLEQRGSFESLIIHEVAHLKAWREHGHAISPHGREFKQICRAVTDRSNCTRTERSIGS